MNYCFLPTFHGDACLKHLGGQDSLQLFSYFWYFCTFHQLMAAILIGDLMDSVRRPVEVVCKQKLDLATNPPPQNGGRDCSSLGPSSSSRECNRNPCPSKSYFVFTRLHIKSGETKPY